MTICDKIKEIVVTVCVKYKGLINALRKNPHTKTKKKHRKKKAHKKTALRPFSEKGYSNVSTNEIAKAANVSIGSLYSYFPNKKEIYGELVDDLYSDVLEKIIPEDISPLSPLALIKKYIFPSWKATNI